MPVLGRAEKTVSSRALLQGILGRYGERVWVEAMALVTHVQAPLELAIASQLDKHGLVEAQAHQVERLVDRGTGAGFVDVSHGDWRGGSEATLGARRMGMGAVGARKERRACRGAGQQR